MVYLGFCKGVKGEYPRREVRGAVGCGGVSLLTGEGSGQGAVPLPRHFFLIFGSKWPFFDFCVR